MAAEFNTQISNGEYRLQFKTNNKAHYLLMQSAARRCIDHAHMTNADHIRSMSDEMLKEFICSMLQCKYCQFGSWERCEFLEWLKQPAEEADNEAD